MERRDVSDESTLSHVPAASSPDRVLEASPERFTPGTILGTRYRLVSSLGAGGMGEVYRADDMKLGQTVALKFIARRVAHRPGVLERIVREVRIGRQISHPNVCRVYDIAEVDDQHFIAMEFVDGEDLSSLLRRVGRLPEDKALEVARDLCAGLAAAHDGGVIHRDLKPGNVMIDGRGRVRITDFGLAVTAEDSERETIAGTPAYMAPEQLDGQAATEASDIYSLGLVLYELFTGERLYSGGVTDVIAAHRLPPRRPSMIVRTIAPAVERIILRCLEGKPADRPPSIRDIIAGLPGSNLGRRAMGGGETPSPRFIAAEETAVALPVARAWAYAALTLLLVIAIAALSRYSMLYRQAPLVSPHVLSSHARQVIAAAGYTPRERGTRYWFDKDITLLRMIARAVPSLDRKGVMAERSPLTFLYRDSPTSIVARGRGGDVTWNDPPLDVPGMNGVMLDSRGMLVRFVHVPLPGARATDAVGSWPEFFRSAGLPFGSFALADEEWIAPMDNDAKLAWRGIIPSGPDISVSVRAASLRGKPVYFEVLPTSVGAIPRPPVRTRAANATATATEQFTGVGAFAMVFTIGGIVAALVARRNLLRGRGDRGAARKLSVFVFTGLLAAGFLSADHTRNAGDEWGVVLGMVGNALFNAGAMWLFYIAVEPYVRRRQPELLISWFRVLAGRFRDPLVGRDVLVGCLFGAIIHLLYGHLLVVLPAWLGHAPLPNHAFPEKLAGGVWPLVSLGSLLASVPLQSVATLFIGSAIKSVTRSNALAILVMVVLGTLPNIGREMEAEVPFVAMAAAVYVGVIWKAGLLAGAVALFSSSWLNASLFVFDPASWLFLPTLFYVSVFVALVWWGLRAAAGTRPLLADL